MRRRLLVSTAVIALAAVLVLGVPLGIIGSRLLTRSVYDRLERDADAAAARLAAWQAGGGSVDARALAGLAGPGHRLEVRRPDGTVVAAGARLHGALLRVPAGASPRGLTVSAIAPREERTERVGAVWLAVAGLSFAAVAAAVGLALLQARRLAAPLEVLAKRAARVGEGAPRGALPGAVAEVAAVELALDEADARIAGLIRNERELSANISHQLRSPLTALRLRLEELQRLPGDPDAKEEARAALGQADRLLGTITALEALARAHEHGEAATVNLSAVTRHHLEDTWRERFRRAGRRLHFEPDRDVQARIGAEAARQVLDVLLDNALRHAARSARVSLDTRDARACLSVEDDGPGIPAGEEERVFERRRSLAGGSGVGLAVARQLAREAGGELRLARPRPARFELELPAR